MFALVSLGGQDASPIALVYDRAAAHGDVAEKDSGVRKPPRRCGVFGNRAEGSRSQAESKDIQRSCRPWLQLWSICTEE